MTRAPQPNQGRFIVFEGIGGSGKSSVLQALAAALTERGYAITATRQPGGTPIGARLREIVLDPALKPDIDATAQLFLYAADRYIHVERIIRPALAAGHIVLCDRYDHSTRAYQSAGGGDPAKLEIVNRLATGGLTPDRTYWFDVDPETGRQRSRNANRPELDRFDQEELAFWRRIHASYVQQARDHPEQIKRIDAGQPLEAVIADTLTDIIAFIK
jgi:dTMP kinase